MNLINRFLFVMEEGFNKDSKTIKAYGNCLNEMKKYIFNDNDFNIEQLKLLNAEDYLINWLNKVKNENNLTDGSLNQRISCLRSFYKWLIGRNDLQINVAASIPLYKNDNINTCDPLSFDECKLLLDSVRNEMILNTNITTTRINLILGIFLGCGLRIDEVHELNIYNFDYENKCLHLEKTKFNKHRTVSVPTQLFEDLSLYLEYRLKLNDKLDLSLHECLFISKKYNRLSVEQIRKLVYKELDKLNLRKVDVHSLRKSYVTNMIDSGADIHVISNQVGHSNINTTLNIYNKPKVKDTEEFNKLFTNNKKDKKVVNDKKSNVIQIQFGSNVI